MNWRDMLKAEVKRVCKSLAWKPMEEGLGKIKAVNFPVSYRHREKAELTDDSPELKLRLHSLKRFNDMREEFGELEVKNEFRKEYVKKFEEFLFREANKIQSRESQENLEDCLHGEEDVFLRKTITEAVVLRKFDGFVWVFTVKGEEFPVKVKERWPGLGFSVRVGDVLRVFKPQKVRDGSRIDLVPELVCCYNIDLEGTEQFLENLVCSKSILEDFLRCQAIWDYILNHSVPVADEKMQADFCKTILCICKEVASLQTPVQMSEMAKQFWYSFKGTKFLKDILPGIIIQELLQSDFDGVQVFIENIVKVIPECAISVNEILKNFYLKRPPDQNDMIFMQKLISSLAENVPGAKDNIQDLQWNHKPLVPATTELLDFAPDWRSLPCIKVKKKDEDRDFTYSSDEEYLNTIFTLLREECFFNLKDGIGKYLKDGEFDSRNVMLYRISLVKAASDFCHDEGLAFLFDFKHSKVDDQALSVDPDNSRWLLSGNLLCISLDASFRHPIWATVANIKDREKLTKDKHVYITFCTEMNSLSDAEVIAKLQKLNDKGDEAYMFESNTFYVAYGPPMDVLQHKESIPFKEQLVEVKTCTDQPPDYLKNIKTRPDWEIFFKNPSDRLTTTDYSYDELLKEFKDQRNDPKCEPKMDEKQLDAVNQALRNKLSLIQGPPGTGKSYVGERFLQFILSCLPKGCGPILVVTYKNFALDHFLEDCLTNIPNFKSMLVRVGRGGSEDQNEDLHSCKLFQLLKENRDRSRKGIHIDLERNLSNQLDSMKQQILYYVKQLRCANKYSNIAHAFIQEAELKHLKSLIGDELDSMTRDGNDLWRVKHYKELLEMLKGPLNAWLPTKDIFLQLCTVYSDLGSSETKVKDSSSDEEGEANGETDPNSDNEERLGTFDEEEQQCTDEQLDTCQSNDDKDVLPDIPYEKLGNLKSILNAGDLCSLNEQEKIQFVFALLRQHNNTITEKFTSLTNELTKKCKTKKELSDRLKIDILKKRRVIGMTVSGAAIKASWLETIKPSVMIVEEAAEILEPQLVAIIPTSVEHLIMIGDQEQLKPQVSHHKLGRNCNLQTSMFERLIKGGLDYTQLNKQGRMTDDLAEVVRRLGIYERYETRQEVVESNWKLPPSLTTGSMFFYAHTKPERDGDGTHSKCNEYEAKKVAQFAKHLCDSCNIKPSKITILCSYLAQVKYIKSILGKEGFSSVQEIHVTTIDSFQGKEKEIIILSLVRSGEGKDAKIGYLASMNRICVAVSRARCGLYLFGNKNLLKRRSNRGWKKVIDWMEKKHCVGDLEKSFPFSNQQREDTQTDGPVGNQPSPSRSDQNGSNVTCRTVNVNFSGPVGNVQIGNQNTTTTISEGDPCHPDKPREQRSPRMSSSNASATGIQPEASPVEETNKVDTPGCNERTSMEETSKVLGDEMTSTEETRKSDVPPAPERDLPHDLEPRESSFYDPEQQSSESPSERHIEGTENFLERVDDGVNNRLPQQGTNCPVNNPVQEDTSTADTTHEGGNVDHHSTSVQEGDAGTPVQEEKNNTAFQESKTDCLESYPVQDTNPKSSDK